MQLLDLPPELIDLIIDLSVPEGLENFALSCSTVYRRATSQIRRHNASRKKWIHTTNALGPRLGDTMAILYEIAREPSISWYIESLDLWDRRSLDDVANITVMDGFHYRKEIMDKVRDLLQNVDYFADTNMKKWLTHVLEKDQSPETEVMDMLGATVALLSLLPNLKTLQLPHEWYEILVEKDNPLISFVKALVAMANTSSSESRPLAKLETIFPFVEEDRGMWYSLEYLKPFMALHSLRNLYVISCFADDENWRVASFLWPNPSFKSSLTRIEFASCTIEDGALSILLANTPALTVFRYSHQSKDDDIGYDWNPGAFLDVIANYTSERLLELALTIDDLDGEIVNGLSSFMRFEKLRLLEVDVEAFCGPPVESGQWLGRNSYLPDGATPWTHMDIPCIGDMLPTSICELHVNTNFPRPSEQALIALFKNIVDRRQDKLVDLKTVVIRQFRADSAREIADNCGVILEAFEMETNIIPSPRSFMPLWKRQLDDIVGGIISVQPL